MSDTLVFGDSLQCSACRVTICNWIEVDSLDEIIEEHALHQRACVEKTVEFSIHCDVCKRGICSVSDAASKGLMTMVMARHVKECRPEVGTRNPFVTCA